MDSAANHPAAQNVADAVQNGEVRCLDTSNLSEKLKLTLHDQDDAWELCSLRLQKDNIQTYTSFLGPIGEKVEEQSAKTSSEFHDLADAHRTPEEPAATGQPLTREFI